MDDSERIQFIGGQVLALMHFATVLINTHPNRASLRKHFEFVKQVGLAKVEGQPVPDAYLDGMNEVHEQIEKTLGNAN
jgi:hypothetical protein